MNPFASGRADEGHATADNAMMAKGRNSRPCSASPQSDAGRIEAGPHESVCVRPRAGLNEALSREGRRRETERMNPLKSPHALLLLAGLFSIDAHAGAVSPDLHSGMRGGDERAVRSSDGGASRIDEIDCMSNPERCVHKAAWYQDRDNSMSPVSPEEGVGAAMAVIASKVGYSQGIQVCPGVYLATAHGALDNPIKAKKEGRALRDPNNNMHYIDPYPMSDDEYMKIESAKFTSPRLRDPSAWSDPTTDYVFIKVSDPIRPDKFVRPIRSSNQRLVNASRRGEIDVHLYRPPTRFNTDSKGTPVFSKGLQVKTFEQISPLYNAPMKVNQPCELKFFSSTLLGSSCPTEQSVSGSTYSTNINGQDYLVSLHIKGDAHSYERFSDDDIPNLSIPSSEFCKDYESVCGEPCAELDEVLPQ